MKYVCVLSTDNYLLGVLVLNENLNKVNSKYSLLCLINENISNQTKQILSYFNIEWRILKNISFDNINEQNPYWIYTFDKLNIFSLIEFEKIVYLDLDLLILENIDNLFEYDKLSLAPDYPFHPDKFNSGVMVVLPNLLDFNNLVDLAYRYNIDGQKISDQDVINAYFENRINSLPHQYNCMREVINDCYFSRLDYINNTYIDKLALLNYSKDINNPIIVHYIGKTKPFMIDECFDDEFYYLYMYYLNNVMFELNNYNILNSGKIISIIIPVYNKEKYLDKCLQSVINQTYKNIEIIIIDDCSTDNSLLICEKYKSFDKRIVILKNKINMGVSFCRNIGIKNSHGYYIGFVDADDYIENIMYEELIKNALNYDLDICQCSTIVDGNREYEDYNKLFVQTNQCNIYADYMARTISYVCWDKLYKRDVLVEFNEKLRINEDFEFMFKVLENVNRIGYINNYLYNYTYQKDDSLTGINECKDNFDMLGIITNIKNYLIKKYPELIEYVDNFIFIHHGIYINKLYNYFANNELILNSAYAELLKFVKLEFSNLMEKYIDYKDECIMHIKHIDEILSTANGDVNAKII